MVIAGVTIALLSIFACIVHRAAGANPCIPKSFGQSSVVCVCNSTYCDTVDPLVLPPKGKYVKYESSKAGKRLERSEGTLQAQSPIQGLPDFAIIPGLPVLPGRPVLPGLLSLELKLNTAKLYQKIKGFGGAVTDSASINILSLSDKTQDNLINSYFSENGIQYNLLRVPMASCDFSTRVYTYCDSKDDFELKKFSLQYEDLNLKIPVIKRAMAISKNLIYLFASPWGPPCWLKRNDAVTGGGTLKGTAGDKYHKTWANYFIRFLDEYKKHQLTFWAVTAQNEPTAGLVPNYPWQCLGFDPILQRDFIAKDLGPAFANSAHSAVKLISIDDRRQLFPAWPIVVLSDPLAAKYIHGFGVHWYQEGATPASASLGATHKLYPDYFLLATEACHEAGPLPNATAVQLGNWERGNAYSHSIIEDLTNFVTGWVDWNIALDMQGGPNWVKNYVDSPVIVVPEKDVFYKQPMFYHMGHFSKFIPEDSQRVDLDFSPLSPLESVALLRPDGAAVVVVLNKTPLDVPFTISDPQLGSINTISPADTIQTYLWSRQ